MVIEREKFIDYFHQNKCLYYSITIIEKNSFTDLISLTKLILRKNKIRKIEDHTLSNMKLLEKLDLSCNQILFVENNSFSKKIQDLILANNNLTRINLNQFSKFDKIKSLTIFQIRPY